MPADEDDCMTIPDRNILPIADDKRLFPMFENEPATSEAVFTNAELTKANMEMKTANAPYVVMTFNTESEARSGHWNGKTTRSNEGRGGQDGAARHKNPHPEVARWL